MNASKFVAAILAVVVTSGFTFSGDVVAADGKPGKKVWVNDLASALVELKQGNEACSGSRTFHTCYVFDQLSRVLKVATVNRPMGIGQNTKELNSYRISPSGEVMYAVGQALQAGPTHFADNGNALSYLAGGLSGAVASIPNAVATVVASENLGCSPNCGTTINNANTATATQSTNVTGPTITGPSVNVNTNTTIRMCGSTPCP